MSASDRIDPWHGGLLAGKTALVTGASQGIGREIALAFARHGATVLLASRRTQPLEDAAAAIGTAGGSARVLVADLADLARVRELCAQAGAVDVLVNNAAAHGVDVPTAPLLESADDHFDTMLAVNLRGPYVLARELGRGMAARKTGVILNISSVAADWITPGHGLYGASKAALNVLTRTLALELGPSGVRCNAIAPGLVETRDLRTRRPEALEHLRKMIPLRRAGRMQEIADIALWLASDASSFVTGQVITADGGMTLGIGGEER